MKSPSLWRRFARRASKSPCRHFARAVFEQLESRLPLAATITVNTTADGDVRDDVLTLREAIHVTNRTLSPESLTAAERAQVDGTPAEADRDTIAFQIPGPGVHTIRVTPPMPVITDPVIIDGYTQPGAAPNTNPFPQPLNGTLRIVLRAAFYNIHHTNYGLELAGGNSVVRGLVIQNFGSHGIRMSSSGNRVEGNYVGTTADGMLPAGTRYGVSVYGSAGNTIGGATPEARNLISGNLNKGITISNGAAGNKPTGPANVIQGNFIGVTAAGVGRLSNGDGGMLVGGDIQAIIGGPLPTLGNVISGNGPEKSNPGSTGAGIGLVSDNHHIENNSIGVDAFGGPLGNSAMGISMGARGTTIIGNVIAYNSAITPSPLYSGINVSASHDKERNTENSILRNSIFQNVGPGIRLLDAVPGENDPLDPDRGVNDLQNFPELTAAAVGEGELELTYSVPSLPGNATYPLHVEFFQADIDGEEGQTYLGFDMFTAADYARGVKTTRLPIASGLNIGDMIVATATDSTSDGKLGSTSAFSPSIVVGRLPFGPSVVTSTADSGPGSLRAALLYANSHPGPDQISFVIPGSGVHTIGLASPLPEITDPITIDGYTQPGARPNTNPFPAPLNGALRIELTPAEGAGAFDALTIKAGQSTIRGLAIHGFQGSGLSLQFGAGNVVQGNYLGTDSTGLGGVGNQGDGVAVFASANNRIGGSTPAARNLISGNGAARLQSGIRIFGGSASAGNVIEGNFLGTDAQGLAAIPNGIGITVLNGRQTRIGGPAAGAGNLISGNGAESLPGAGILVQSDGVQIQGNWVGTDAQGQALGNQGPGIDLQFSANTVVENVIAFNGQANAFRRGGVVIGNGSLENAVLRNSIYSNNGLGIDLEPIGVTPNDAGDLDRGANRLQNAPEVRAARRASGQLMLTYRVNSHPANSTYPLRVEFFHADDDGQEGRRYLGFDAYTEADFARGFKTVLLAPTANVFAQERIVATATDAGSAGRDGSTSEFSTAHVVQLNAPPAIERGATLLVTAPEGLAAVYQASASDADSQPLIFRIASGADAHLFNIDQESGALSFKTAPHFAAPADADGDGRYEISLEVTDGAASDTLALTIVIVPAEAAPRFAPGDDQNASDDAGPQFVAGWVAGHFSGEGELNALGAGSRFIVTVDDPSLFVVPPRLDAAGNLTFTPRANAAGEATVTATLELTSNQDGSAVAMSIPQTFSIQINKRLAGHNSLQAEDVDGNSLITAADALTIINLLNSALLNSSGEVRGLTAANAALTGYCDVSGDNEITANDALIVINYLNAFGVRAVGDSEGEGAAAISSQPASDALLELLAVDVVFSQGKGRRST